MLGVIRGDIYYDTRLTKVEKKRLFNSYQNYEQ